MVGKNGERKEKDAGAVLQFSALDYPIIAPKGGVFVRVYLEVVILDNFFIDLLLLSALSALLPPRPLWVGGVLLRAWEPCTRY